jgi:glucose-1-phosphate thymidylyltransferase
MMLNMKQAVILAAGEGQRLRPFTTTKPKAMLSVAGRPILSYVVEALAQNGIRDIVLIVGYGKEQVFDYFGSGKQLGVSINYMIQERQLGTAHALSRAKTATEDKFLVLPGDNLIEASTIARFVTAEPEAILVKRVDNPLRYGVVGIENGTVKEIVEKPREAKSNIVNTGIYAFTRAVFDFIEPELDIPSVLNNMIVQGKPIVAKETEGTWLDVVYPWDILSLNEAVLRDIKARLAGTVETGVFIKGPVVLGKGTVIRSNSYLAGPMVIGDNCDIGPHVCLLPATSIGDNVVVSPFSEIKNSVIGNDVSIGSGCVIQDSVIDKGCAVRGHFTACSGEAEIKINDEYYKVNVGAMIGEGCGLDNCVVAHPGVIVGNFSQVQALKVIRGRLPDRSLVV